MPTDLMLAAARNMAAWHDWQITSHGLATRHSESLWSCPQPAPVIFLNAITVASHTSRGTSETEAEIDELVRARPADDLRVCDSWRTLNLEPLGFATDDSEPVYARPPGTASVPSDPLELEIREVTNRDDLEEFELASVEGFESPTDGTPLRWHAEASLGHANMRYYIGSVGGHTASVSMGCVSDGVVGVYGVATVPDHRRRGYGTAMTQVALNAVPGLPAVLQPSPEGASMYRTMGFAEVGQVVHWVKSGQTTRVS